MVEVNTFSTARILIVEDEASLLEMLKNNLEVEGYRVATASDGEPGLALQAAQPSNLIILDLMLPHMDGFSFLKALRHRGDNTPVLVLTARSEERAKIKGFELGIDDYVTKPFGVLEILHRIRAILRRVHGGGFESPLGLLRSGPFLLDRNLKVIKRDGTDLPLGSQAFRILELLFQHPSNVLCREELVKLAWPSSHQPSLRAVDVQISVIRKALGAEKNWLSTVGMVGYSWQHPVQPVAE